MGEVCTDHRRPSADSRETLDRALAHALALWLVEDFRRSEEGGVPDKDVPHPDDSPEGGDGRRKT